MTALICITLITVSALVLTVRAFQDASERLDAIELEQSNVVVLEAVYDWSKDVA